MKAVEIEEAMLAFAEQPFDADEFPSAFRQVSGAKDMILTYTITGAA